MKSEIILHYWVCKDGGTFVVFKLTYYIHNVNLIHLNTNDVAQDELSILLSLHVEQPRLGF